MKVNEATFCFSSHCVFIAVQILYHPHLKGVSDKIITQNLGASQQPALTQEVLVLLSPPVPHLQTSSPYVSVTSWDTTPGRGLVLTPHTRTGAQCPMMCCRQHCRLHCLAFSIFRSEDGKGLFNICCWVLASRPGTRTGLTQEIFMDSIEKWRTSTSGAERATRACHCPWAEEEPDQEFPCLGCFNHKKLLNQRVNVAAMKTKSRS